jgi:hypothetical protein
VGVTLNTTGIDEPPQGGVATAQSRTSATDSPSLFTRINSTRHHRALKIYIAIVVAHWIEHLVQVVQIYILDMPRPQAGGFLGYLIPAINKDEILHWTYAILMFVGLLLLRPGFKNRSRMWWNVAIGIMTWHFLEHTFLLYQYWSGWHFLDKPVPTSIIQSFFPRFELHLVYNMLVMLPILAAISVHWLGPKEIGPQGDCDCRRHFR